MPIDKKEVFKSIFKSKQRKPIKEKQETQLNRKKYVKSNGRYFAPENKKTNEKIKKIEEALKHDDKTNLLRFFDNDAISKSSPLDSRLGTYYEFENGVIMSILTTEGTEVSSLTLNFELSPEELKQEKVPGLYHLMIQLLLSEKFIELEENWDPLRLFSFREYMQKIGGKINVQYLPSCIMLSIGCASKHYIKVLEYFFDTIYLTKKGMRRRMKLTKSGIEEALINMNINYLELIHDETYLRFEILRDFLRRSRKSIYKTKNHKTIDVLNTWSLGSELTVFSLVKEGNLEFEVLNAYNRIIRDKSAIIALHSNLTHGKLFSILNDYNIPLFNEKKESSESKKISDILKDKKNKIFVKKNSIININNEDSIIEMPPITLPEIKSSIIVNSPVQNTRLSNGEIELQWIMPAFFSSLNSSNTKPLKIISYLFEFGPLLKFLRKRKLVDSINSGEMYFAAHSSQRIGFTIFSVMLRLSESVKSNINPRSPVIQFIVQCIFTYIYSLILQFQSSINNLSMNLSKTDDQNKNSDNNPFLVIDDIKKIENYISNSNYQMNSEKDNYIDYFDRNFEITETVIQNIKSHNPSEILVGNNRFYSNIKIILKYVKYTLESAFKSTNFMLYVTSSTYFKEDNQKKFFELKLKLSDFPKLYYSELKFENLFLDLLKDPITLKKYLIKMDPIKNIVIKNNLINEYDFLIEPQHLLKNSKLTFIDGKYEWNTFSNSLETENPILGTIPFISSPIPISEDHEGRFSTYYSQITYPNNTESIYQSSLSSAIFRWYESFDYSQVLQVKKSTSNLAKNSLLSSFLSRILFTIWVTSILASNFISYKKLGATVNFQPCSFFGTALLTNCLQLQITSPSPMFSNYLNEVLNSIKSISMLNITDEIADKLRKDAIKEIENSIYSSSLSNSCTEKIKQLLLPELITSQQILLELENITNEEIMILLDKKLTFQNPYISIVGLITHIENPKVGVEMIKESFVSDVCYKELNQISSMFNDKSVETVTYIHPVLDKINISRVRLMYLLNSNHIENNKKEGNAILVSSLWISVPENNLYNKALLILVVQVIHYVFKNIYLSESFLINKESKRNINLLAIPSPFLNQLGLQFILEIISDDITLNEDITASYLLLDFLSFIENSKILNQDFHKSDQSTKKPYLSHSSLSLVYKQIRTEVMLQLLSSQTQVVSQSSFLFGRIAQVFESNDNLNSGTMDKITNEKKDINKIIEKIDLNSTISFTKTLIKNSSMIIVESNTYNHTIYDFHNELIDKYDFKILN